MMIATLKLKFHIPWAKSLKDKRMVVKSMCAKLRDKFSVSTAEVDGLDVMRIAVIGVAYVGNSRDTLDSVMDHILAWIENSSDAELIDIEREIL
jgi:uncharacterized protein YlxP (DUF503 family)